ERIVEHKDANDQELLVDEINTGTYCFDNQALFAALKEVSNDNAQREYYLPDVIEIMRGKSEKVSAYQTNDFEETLGINDRVALSEAEQIMKKRINEHHMRNGVTIIDPTNTYIGLNVTMDGDVIIHPGSIIKGNTTVGIDSEIGPHVDIENCTIGAHTIIKQSVMKDSMIKDHAEVGPYAYIRPGSSIGIDAKVGQFVEIKEAQI